MKKISIGYIKNLSTYFRTSHSLFYVFKRNKMKNKFTEKFLSDSFQGCVNNKSEVLKYDICGCFNCLEISKTENIVDWNTEPNGGEETATCPNCTFDSVLSNKYPIEDFLFLIEIRNYHFEN